MRGRGLLDLMGRDAVKGEVFTIAMGHEEAGSGAAAPLKLFRLRQCIVGTSAATFFFDEDAQRDQLVDIAQGRVW